MTRDLESHSYQSKLGIFSDTDTFVNGDEQSTRYCSQTFYLAAFLWERDLHG